MKRSDLEHIIRAASAITNEYEIMVVGSQSILGTIFDPPASLVESMEAVVYPVNNPDMADLIDGSIGEGSIFHERFNYYAQGVGPDTAILPAGWKDRLVKIQNQNTNLRIGYCLDACDLAASKLVANREKDLVFVSQMLLHDIVATDDLKARIRLLPIGESRKNSISRWIDGQDFQRHNENDSSGPTL